MYFLYKLLSVMFLFSLHAKAEQKSPKTTTPQTPPPQTPPPQTSTPSLISLSKYVRTDPVILVANRDLAKVQYFPISNYRMFATDVMGKTTMIPFQIDEIDPYGDFVLFYGKEGNPKLGNDIFDGLDELSMMGHHIGSINAPKDWGTTPKPDHLAEISFQKNGKKEGSIFLGVYKKNPPPAVNINYVSFDLKEQKIKTQAFEYRFNKDNYLVVRGIDINKPDKKVLNLVQSSTFFIRADLKYFLTFDISHSDMHSELAAYKIGPIRNIVRVNFTYKLMKLNLDLGMYTEISFFSNAVILPAIIDNPLNGKTTLNPNSLFYYGFALEDNPKDLKFTTNMTPVGEKGHLEKNYSLIASSKDYMIYIEFEPSEQMIRDENVPQYFVENHSGAEIRDRDNSKAQPLGKSPVNMAVAFDIANLSSGIHKVGFKIFVAREYSEESLKDFKEVKLWRTGVGVLY